MRAFRLAVLTLLIAFAAAANAGAAGPPGTLTFEQFRELNQGMGIAIISSKEGATTSFTTTLSTENLHDVVSWLKSIDAMNPDLTETAENVMPVTLSNVALQTIAMTTIMEIYQTDATVDKVKYVARLDMPNEYGKTQITNLFSFAFTRALYNKINWDRMQPKNFPKVANNFHYTSWAMSSMRQEIAP